MKRMLFLLGATCSVAILSGDASAQLFRDQMIDAGAWGINQSSSDNTATFAYDYSADGIPEAPNSQGGDASTQGVKLESNNTDFLDASGEFMTLYPLGQNFTGKYQLKFDAWQNYSTFDRENDGGAGTTEFLGGGIGYDNVSADVGSGHVLISTSEGGSGSDYRGFKGTTFIDHADMASGNRNATCCGPTGQYETLFPGGSGVPPASQGQTGTPNESRAGSSSFQWFTHTISVDGNEVRHQMTNKDGLRRNILAYDTTVLDAANVVPTDGNIMLFYADFFSSVSPSAGVTFGIVDNVSVGVPEPASILMLGMGSACLTLVRRRR